MFLLPGGEDSQLFPSTAGKLSENQAPKLPLPRRSIAPHILKGAAMLLQVTYRLHRAGFIGRQGGFPMKRQRITRLGCVVLLAIISLAVGLITASAQNVPTTVRKAAASFTIPGATQERVVHAFNPGTRGDSPYANLISDGAGNLYGTTYSGGSYTGGTVYELTPNGSGGWTEKTLFNFDNGIDGAQPYGGLIFDAAGNLYGTTVFGGIHGYGIVFELMPNGSGGWLEKVLHNFRNGTDGAQPYASLIFDAAGNLYGTTSAGGTNGGTVFELTPNGSGGWTETVLHHFGSGDQPDAGVIFDAAGNLYGTTAFGGTRGQGIVFELMPNGSGGWTEKVLHNFGNGTDGSEPWGSLILDRAGNLYGTTAGGGMHRGGTVFELTPNGSGGWTEKTLFNFDNGIDGARPAAGLIFDAAGNLYGTTVFGGIHGSGIVFELMPNGSGGWAEKVLRNFGNGYNGVWPNASVILDAAGNLYGTTSGGGSYGLGTVFELTPTHGGQWTEKLLYNFSLNGRDGFWPEAGLISDAAGNLYGTTSTGGASTYGAVYELMPSGSGGWTEKVLHSFSLYTDPAGGQTPIGGLILDRAGNLYGTTYLGGTYQYGTVFELTPNGSGGWTDTVLHTFGSGTDGVGPWAGLILDRAGNLYGTTPWGGTYSNGIVFELTPNGSGGWTETVLHNFGSGTDGSQPLTSLIFDAVGNLYGTTQAGGTYGGGTVFELTPQGGETVLHNFGSGTDGSDPWASLIFDSAGNLYGTTQSGGLGSGGTVFQLTPNGGGGWTEKVLYNFNVVSGDGVDPTAALVFDSAGNLYGTTDFGGTYGYGTVFELTPNGSGGWTETVLHVFSSGTDGASPFAGLIFDAAGNLYGTTEGGGTHQYGTVFEITP
jgi:uncharacterized repeat protein (TIGR03803 family)